MVYRFGTWFGWLKTGRGDDVHYGDEREHEHEDDVAGDSRRRCCVDRKAQGWSLLFYDLGAFPFVSAVCCEQGMLGVTEVQALAN